jgi:hypothetical protein
MNRIDPSGHVDCAAGDSACWVSEWTWKNRWYEAHGWFWNNGGWSRQDLANFSDEDILRQTVGEAGIVFEYWGVLGGKWEFARNSMMWLVAQGVVAFANKLGGLSGFAQLGMLLGGGTTSFYRDNASFDNRPAYTQWWPGGDKHAVMFQNPLAGCSDTRIRGTAVHELAHIIDYNYHPGGSSMSDIVPKGYGLVLSEYAETNDRGLEYWAEAVAFWVFDSPMGNPYREEMNPTNPFSTLYPHIAPYPMELRTFLENTLMVHP